MRIYDLKGNNQNGHLQQLERNTELLSDDDDISGPYCVDFRSKDGVIVVGGYENNKLFLYQIS